MTFLNRAKRLNVGKSENVHKQFDIVVLQLFAMLYVETIKKIVMKIVKLVPKEEFRMLTTKVTKIIPLKTDKKLLEQKQKEKREKEILNHIIKNTPKF